MGWSFEHLGEELKDEIVEKLKRFKEFKEINHIEVDRQISRLTDYGEGYPSCGAFKGLIKVENKKGILRLFNIDFVIKRAIPSDGYDYGDYENEYECILKKTAHCLKKKKMS